MSSPTAGGGASNPFGVQFTPEEEEEFGEMARSEGFYERFAKSVGPSIYGSLGSSRTVRWVLKHELTALQTLRRRSLVYCSVALRRSYLMVCG